jgi:threonine dehydrogenase-like Zn-dependent dehydrogenase
MLSKVASVASRNVRAMSTMRGFAMRKIGEVGWLENVEVPEADPMCAIIKPLAVAPCTSDIHTVWAGAIGERTDLILGHEAVGEVMEVGSMVEDFKVGDKVIVPAITPDWGTVTSQGGHGMHSKGMLAGWKFSNIKNGVFGERFHVNEADANLALIPEGMDLKTAVMLVDMCTTGFHGAELANIGFGDSVAVIGIGPVGLMSVAASALAGAGRLFAVGGRKVCQDAAIEYGATDIINYREGDIVEQIMAKTNGEGVDRVILAGGEVDVLTQCVTLCKAGGTISNVNYHGVGDLTIPRVDWGCGMGHKTIAGGLCPGGRRRMEKLAQLVMNGRMEPGKMVTHEFEGFEHIEEALMLMKDKPEDLIKPVVYTGL